MQALFRKIAAALPGMESINQAKTEQPEEIKTQTVTLTQQQPQQPPPSSCAC